MRIGITTSVVARGQTGVSRYVCSLVKAFLEHAGRHQFTLFVLEDDLPLFSFAEGRMGLVKVNEAFRTPVRDIFWHQTALANLARAQRLEVVHVPSYRRMLWPRPCPLVATIHDLAPFHVAGKYEWKRMLYGRYAARLLARRQNQIIAISQGTARDVAVFFHVPAERLSVIYNGVDHEHFCPGPAEVAKQVLEKKYGIKGPFFIYVARLEHPGKNHLRLIAAFEQFKQKTLSPWQLVLAGKDWTGAEAIHDAVKKSPYSSDIHCLGFVADQDLPALYRAAEALVAPSLFEGFGLPLVEAMACGCPVLCSSSGAVAEVVNGAALMADPEDANAWQIALGRLASDPKLRLRLRELGLIQAQQFNWRKTAAATLQVYQRAKRDA